jgi:hypothetical protein
LNKKIIVENYKKIYELVKKQEFKNLKVFYFKFNNFNNSDDILIDVFEMKKIKNNLNNLILGQI